MSYYLFTSGTARGGTNLRAQILSVNKDIRLASDPFLPLFREFRNAIIEHTDDVEVKAALDPNSPLDDYYFSPVKLQIMKYVQEANLDVPFVSERWTELQKSLLKRTSLASADLVPYLNSLPGSSFRDVFTNAVNIIKKARGADRCKWVGFNENWAVEFFAPLARAFPEARFMIHLRDPRGAIDGALHAESDPLKIPHVISFAKHWRKYVAFILEYRRNSLFDKQLLVTTYEPIVLNPEKHVKEITDFLGVEFDVAMVDTANFRMATGDGWPVTWDIYGESIEIWKRRLPGYVIEVIEFICDPEMRLFGYSPVEYHPGSRLSDDAIAFILKDSRECVGWRTDFRQAEKDIGFELFRKSLLNTRDIEVECEIVERCFLFRELYNSVKGLTGPGHLSDVK